MNSKRFTNGIFLASTILLIACRPTTHQHHEASHEHAESKTSDHGNHETGSSHESGISFHEKSGLTITPETAKYIGLEVVEVDEGIVTSEFSFPAQVYQIGPESRSSPANSNDSNVALASALLSGSDVALLNTHQPLRVTHSDGATFDANLLSLETELIPSNKTREVLLSIKAPSGTFKVGSFVEAKLIHGSDKKVMQVPRSALLRTTDGDFVYTQSGGAFTRAAIKLGTIGNDSAEILDGLYSGDEVVVRPVMSLWLTEIQALRGGVGCSHGH